MNLAKCLIGQEGMLLDLICSDSSVHVNQLMVGLIYGETENITGKYFSAV